jgi:thioredoxin 1
MSKKTPAVGTHDWDEQVIHSAEPVLVDFWAPWCPPCRMIAPYVDELAAEWAGRVKVLGLNIDENPEIAERYRVHSIPTLLLFQNGQVAGQRVGALPKTAIAHFVDSNLTVERASATS